MDAANLVHMANRIGAFFASMPDRVEACAGVAEHVCKFWDPRMRRQLLQHADTGAAPRLDPLVGDAVSAHRASIEPKARAADSPRPD